MVDPISTSKCPSKCLSHTTSPATNDNAPYSDSAKGLETVPCFTYFHEISASPRNTQNPIVVLRVPLHQKKLGSVRNFEQETKGLILEQI